MRFSCGIDIIQISRIVSVYERKGRIFLDRIYTPLEVDDCLNRGVRAIESMAVRFAAKEAVAKALGTGIGPFGIGFRQIEVVSEKNGRPVILLHGDAREYFTNMGGYDIQISLSHDGDYGVAMCTMQFNTIENKGDFA